MLNNRFDIFYPELPVGTKMYNKVNKKTYKKITSNGILSKWISENGASILISDDHVYNKEIYQILSEENQEVTAA